MMDEYIISSLTLMLIAIVNKMTHILDVISKKDKKRLKWISFLTYDKNIDCCTFDFKKMNEMSWPSFIFGNILIGIVITAIFIGTIGYTDGATQSPYRLLVWISITIIFIITSIHNHIDECALNISNFTEFKRIKSKFDFLSGSTIITTLTTPIFLYIVISNHQNIKATDFMLYFLVIALLLLANIMSKNTYKNLIHKLEFMLLEKYSETFPHIYVKADARELQGKVQDIFNNNFIVFGYNGLKIPVEWDKITSIKLSERTVNEAEKRSL